MAARLYEKLITLKEKGQGLVEYAIVVAVVIAAAVLLIGVLNGSFDTLYTRISGIIAGATSGQIGP